MTVPLYSTAPTALAADPSYLAFARASGLQDQYDITDAERQSQMLRRVADRSLEDIATSGVDERRDIVSSLEAQGRTGGSLAARQLSRQQAREAGQVGDVNANLVDRISALNTQTARSIAGRQGSLAERGMELSYNKALRAA